ncbi:PD-(D/E)XK nuclease family protein [Azorhizobium doebereinerae]|uniref:PD-(D/E)XK nuclease family protein n=1 Tax=Azorhizobium doebereinerae TaxID=281091 RepID=UPI000414FC61|nr:PD-(D/E)XK nuclease family protein [Azorhizobium doebereinerae]
MAPFKMQERDVDLFILEELYSDTGFANWLAAQVGIDGADFLKAEHSVSAKVNAKWGETDVLVYFDKAGTRIAVLIEDKISARFADAQCDRYHERANELVGEGLAAEYKLVLIAPNTYLSSVPKSDTWHCQLAIDDIASWFAQKNGSHANWRASALRSCLENVSKITSASKIEVKSFSEDFSNFLRGNAPEFSHDPTGDAYGLSVKWADRPTGFSIFWKVSQDLVDLEIMGDHRSRIGILKDKVGLVDRSKASTGMLGIPVKTASWGQPLSEQLDVVSEVVAACQRLRLIALEIAAMP